MSWKVFIYFSVAIVEIYSIKFNRTVGDGVKSINYKVIYGDEDMEVINEVVDDMEKQVMKSKINLDEALPPLPSQDLKCLMSADKYCSEKMAKIKDVLIHALKEDCSNCTVHEKETIGKVVASMMVHDPVAWKMFLTRYEGLKKIQRIVA